MLFTFFTHLKKFEKNLKTEHKEITLFPKPGPLILKKTISEKKRFEVNKEAKEIIIKSSKGSEINYTGYDNLLQKVEELESLKNFLLENGIIKLDLHTLQDKHILVTCTVSNNENIEIFTNLSDQPICHFSFTEKDVGKTFNIFYIFETPEGHWFVIPLKDHHQKISVKVIEGKDLPKLDIGIHHSSDPYVILTYNGVTHKTKVIYNNNLNPIWNETFTFDITDITKPLSISAFDKDLLKDDTMGSYNLDLSKIFMGYNDIWVPLPQGQVHIEIDAEGIGIYNVEKLNLNFVEQIQNLNIQVCKTHGLEEKDDYLCIVSIGSQAKRGPIITGENPNFDHVYHFSILDTYVTEIKIEVFNRDRSKFYGRFTLPVSKIFFQKKYTAKLKTSEENDAKGSIEFIIEKNIEFKESERKIFGVPLADVMKREHEVENIPLQIKYLLDFLNQYGPQFEGIFRISGSTDFVNDCVSKMDKGNLLLLNVKNDIENLTHNVSSIFKKYIRDLPSPLLTYEYFEVFLNLLKIENEEEQLLAIEDQLKKIPKENYELLVDLIKVCIVVEALKDQNKMTVENLAVVFGIGILKSQDEIKNTYDIGNIQKVFISIFKIFKRKHSK